jgi:hypothetical protein
MAIDCGRCDTRGGACQDCLVEVLAPDSAARRLEAEELRALGVLADAGMISPLRLNVANVASGRAAKAPGTPRTWAFPATKAS